MGCSSELQLIGVTAVLEAPLLIGDPCVVVRGDIHSEHDSFSISLDRVVLLAWQQADSTALVHLHSRVKVSVMSSHLDLKKLTRIQFLLIKQ